MLPRSMPERNQIVLPILFAVRSGNLTPGEMVGEDGV
jgi:hypothetical protein